MLNQSPKKENGDTQKVQVKASQKNDTEDKGVRIEKIIEELPELLVNTLPSPLVLNARLVP